MNKIAIIGSGFSSLAAACYLAKEGYEVDVYEKNSTIGGRARQLKKEGFTFDMGPSWYWMPDVFDRFFNDFSVETADYYTLERLDPAYRVYFEDGTYLEIPGSLSELQDIFEKEEAGSAKKLEKFLKEAEYNYRVAIEDLVYKPGISPLELVTPATITKISQFFTSISTQIRKRFKSKKLVQILEFPVLFLGAKPQDTPAFYNFMNYADLVLGTWYPKGGMYRVVQGIELLALELGVRFHTNANVSEVLIDHGQAKGLRINGQSIYVDVVLSGADYQHTETLLPEHFRMYSEKYWSKKVFAPSALLFYVGFNKKLTNLKHHMLFFDEDFDTHARDIYDHPQWPEAPLFYASFTSVSDASIAPVGKECGTFLIPLAPGLDDTPELRNTHFTEIIARLEKLTHQSVAPHIQFMESYCISDFKKDYNSYKGNAYGMANTLTQTAFLRPKIRSSKVKNLYFTGQLTVPGPGVPPALISGKIAAQQIIKMLGKKLQNHSNEVAI